MSSFLEHRLNGIGYRASRLFERLRGIDIVKHHSLSDFHLDASRSVWYVNSGNKYLRRVLDLLPITDTDCLFDFGVGKGGVLFTAARYPFAALGGIDIVPTMIMTCRRNAERLRIKKPLALYTGDAASIRPELLIRYNFFYFFNPFPEVVMQEVMHILLASLRMEERDTFIIYKNPVCHSTIMHAGPFKHILTVPADFGMEFRVYRACTYSSQ